jgi:membrane carboxypeptidase/penicillin-binding protein
VWFGYDTPRSISSNAAGGRLAAPAWAEIIHAAWREPAGSAWVPPAEMDTATIDPESGQLAGRWCPRHQREFFKPGTAPTETCTLHDAPPFTFPSIANGAHDLLRAIQRGLKGIIIHY